MTLLDHIEECHMRDCLAAYRRAVPWTDAMRAQVQAVLVEHDQQPSAIPALVPVINDWILDTYV